MQCSALKNACKYAFSRHNTVTDGMINSTMSMTLLTDLRHFQKYVPGAQQGPYRQGSKVKSRNNQVFAEGSEINMSSFFSKRIYLIGRKKTHLTMPLTTVCITFNSPMDKKIGFFYRLLLHASFSAYTNSFYLSHIITHRFDSWSYFPLFPRYERNNGLAVYF